MPSGLPRPTWLPELDLRSLTRNSDRSATRISVVLNHEPYVWIRCGLLSRFDVDRKRQWLGAYFDHGITDAEESSAYAFHIDVVGARLHDVHHGVVELRAWIAGQEDDARAFCVPTEPLNRSELKWCPTCKGPPGHNGERHQVTDYTPPPNVTLWKKLRGAEVIVQLLAVIPEDER
jgi:hypothetical protein